MSSAAAAPSDSSFDADLMFSDEDSSAQSQEIQQQQRDNDNAALLSDLNTALHRIVTSSDDNIEDEDGGPHVTLSDLQLSSLRKLERRIRSAMAQSQMIRRRVITGDANKRVRDWAKEAKVVKTVDKFSFVLGVSVLCGTEFMVLRYPEHFGMYYVVLISIMMALRLYIYAKMRYSYFLYDFCYCANVASFVSVLALPENERLWRLNFCVSNGTLLGALLAWRNSLVFHSLDKVTSIAIHLLPGLLAYTQRWSDGTVMCFANDDDDARPCSMLGFCWAILDCTLFYAAWQLLYILKTEIIDRKRFLADPSIQTSLRWLTRDSKNPMHRVAKKVCRSIGVLRKDEDFDPDALKTKLVFWIGQLIFTLITLIPTPLLFVSYAANTGYILLVLSTAVWNGSNYYFEVFASRYLQSIEQQQEKAQSSSEEPETKRKEGTKDGIKEE